MPDGEGFNGFGGTGDGDAGNVGGAGTGGNPAWQPFLEVVPQDLHDKVTPLLQQWDQGVNQRFEKVHSEYAPWKQYMDAGVTPDQVNMALGVLNTIQENPEYVYKSLAEFHKFGQEPAGQQGANNGQGQGEPEGQEFRDPRYDTLEHQFKQVAEVLLAQQEQAVNAQEDAELDNQLKELRKTHGDYDEDYVLAKMQAGMDAESAVKEFQAFMQRVSSQGPKPFSFLGGNSGGVPGTNTDVRKLSDAQARQAAMQMLQHAAHEKNQ